MFIPSWLFLVPVGLTGAGCHPLFDPMGEVDLIATDLKKLILSGNYKWSIIADDIKTCRSIKHVMCEDALRYFGDRLDTASIMMKSAQVSLEQLGDIPNPEIRIRNIIDFVETSVDKLAQTCLEIFRVYDFVAVGTDDYDIQTRFMNDYAMGLNEIVVRASIAKISLEQAVSDQRFLPLIQETFEKNEESDGTLVAESEDGEESDGTLVAENEEWTDDEGPVGDIDNPEPVELVSVNEFNLKSESFKAGTVKTMDDTVLETLCRTSLELKEKMDEMRILCNQAADGENIKVVREHLSIIRSIIQDLKPEAYLMNQLCAQAIRLKAFASSDP